VRHMPVVVMIIVTALGAAALRVIGQEPPAIAALVVLGVIGVGLIFWARGGSAAELERLRASALSRDNRLAGIQDETDRMRADLQRALGQQREAEERARAAETAADRQKQSEMALRESRAEVERLKKDVEAARRHAMAATAAPAAAPAPPRVTEPATTAAPAAPAAPARPAPASAAAAPPRPAAPAPPPAPPRPAPAAPAPPPAPPRPAPARAPAAPAPPAPVMARPPVAEAPAPAPTGPREPDPAPGTAVGTLLLVDDDPNFLFVAANILRPAGFHVLEAESGQAALERAEQHTGKIDLLVTDMMMPGMNGRQLAQRFTKLRPGVRVLYISGVVDEGSARDAIEGEAADFLGKPFEADTFTAKVRELLRTSSRGG
jgi:CheY-like chemotaxis protein/Skp family chaperone for outer membrane proteins